MENQIWRLEWSDDLSVGIPDIDEQHRDFIDLVNGLNQAIIDRADLPDIRSKLKAIREQAREDFADEEEFFRQLGYPDTAHHMQEHEAIINSLSEMVDTLSDESTMYEWIEVGLKLKETLIEHLLNEDMRYRDYYRSLQH